MGVTGWIGEDPGEQAPAMPATTFLLQNRADPGQGRTLDQALERVRLAPDRDGPEPEDPDERFAGMVSRGYAPGQLTQLSQRLGDVTAELQAEREKLEQGARRAEQVRQMHDAGRIRAWDMMNMLDDLGDEGRVAQLERQQASLQQQIDAASEAIAPPERRDPDPLEAAASRAHALFVEVTRARMADLEAGRPVKRERRPFAGRGVAVRSEVSCSECIKAGASAEESWLIHADPDAAIEAEMVGLSEMTVAAWGRPGQAERRTHGYGLAVR